METLLATANPQLSIAWTTFEVSTSASALNPIASIHVTLAREPIATATFLARTPLVLALCADAYSVIGLCKGACAAYEHFDDAPTSEKSLATADGR